MFRYVNTLILVLTLIWTTTLLAQGRSSGRSMGGRMGANFGTVCTQMPAQDISASEKDALIYMREEEKLARDVYLTLYEKWNFFVFNNIARSENRHTQAVQMLLQRYKIDDPVKNDSIGMFTNAKLAKLYQDLVTQGQKSLKGALLVGATIEDVDIYDLDEYLKKTDNDDIKCVFENLRRGSEKHMRAFVGQLQANGGSYKPQYISQQEYDKILNTAGKRGGGRGMHGGRCF